MGKERALVLCGGEGKRLRPITFYLQKTMIPIGRSQRPLLEYTIRLLQHHRLKDVTLLVNYKANQIKNFFEEGKRFGVQISYIHDLENMQGTGGSVINAYKKKAFSEDDTLLVYYGDILTNMNLRKLIDFHREKGAVATVALASGFTVRVGLADLDGESRILGFTEKPQLEKPVSVGVLILKGEVLRVAAETMNARAIDLMGEIIPNLIRRDQPVYGFVFKDFWSDVGSIEAYEKLDNQSLEKSMSFLFHGSPS
jgi:mannose-1-phosphate guanylyltransferase